MLLFEEVNANITLVKLSSFQDNRGRFSKIFLPENYSEFRQVYVSHNPHTATLRGLHFQSSPFSERKIVLCLEGKVFDVVVAVEPNAAGHHEVYQITLGPDENYQGIVISQGLAHGYLTLMSNTTLLYFVDQEHIPSHSRRMKWDDPKLGIQWPQTPLLMSSEDLNAPFLE
jgi:dTDP-4-dehydrorhamnose 3,5-epimerase